MGRPGNKKGNLKQYNHKEKELSFHSDIKLTKAVQFAISIIYCCFPQSLSQDFAILNGLEPPDNYFINKAFDIIRPIIEQLARDSALRAEEQMPDDATVCMDGSWDHKRFGKLHIFDVICIETMKIIDFEIKIRNTKKRKGNTNVTPQAMEGDAFLCILPRLMQNMKIKEVIKDGDLQIDHIIRINRWNIKLTPDPNHLLLHFTDHFKTLVNPNQKMFRGVCPKILKRLKAILYTDGAREQKLLEIQEMKTFILTQPFLKLGRSLEKKPWKYANNETAKNHLNKVIDFCIDIANTFERRHSTCFNETFHALKAKYLPKNYNLGNSGDIRIYASILHFNEGRFWIRRLYEALKLPVTNIDTLEQFHLRGKAFLKKNR